MMIYLKYNLNPNHKLIQVDNNHIKHNNKI
jgi:hypothetical protein